MPGEARILRSPLTPAEISELAAETFGDMFKVVADIHGGLLAAGGMLHADAEQLLLDGGSKQEDIWGANYFPGRSTGSKLEYSAMINIRPDINRDQDIQSEEVRLRVKRIVEKWVGPA